MNYDYRNYAAICGRCHILSAKSETVTTQKSMKAIKAITEHAALILLRWHGNAHTKEHNVTKCRLLGNIKFLYSVCFYKSKKSMNKFIIIMYYIIL